jgi:hypothetical protein
MTAPYIAGVGLLATVDLIRRQTETSEAQLPLPDPCVTALKLRRQRQDADHERAERGRIDTGLVFTTRHGTPIEPRNFNPSFDPVAFGGHVVNLE